MAGVALFRGVTMSRAEALAQNGFILKFDLGQL